MIEYIENGISEKTYDANIQLLSKEKNGDTKDFFIMYEWKKMKLAL